MLREAAEHCSGMGRRRPRPGAEGKGGGGCRLISRPELLHRLFWHRKARVKKEVRAGASGWAGRVVTFSDHHQK